MAQTLTAEIVNVMFIAKVKNNPASFTIKLNGTGLTLSLINELNLCNGISSDITIGTSFQLTAAPADLELLDELLMVIKFSF